ncbi:MAG: hypothetical protein NVS3B29_00650 [Candidatus Saccharimonadales bacterium]
MSRRYTDEKLLDDLRMLAEELGRTPTSADIENSERVPRLTTYYKHFGSIPVAIERAGLKVVFRGNWSDEKLLEGLQALASRLGYSPSSREIDEDDAIPNAQTYKAHFGNVTEALRQAGLPPWVYWRRKQSQQHKP